MATSVDYIEFVMEYVNRMYGIDFRYKKMFGEYCVYANEKPILLVCDNMVYVKMLPCIEPLMDNSEIGNPYDGAKPHYILDIEDTPIFERVVRLLEQNTPFPKQKINKTI